MCVCLFVFVCVCVCVCVCSDKPSHAYLPNQFQGLNFNSPSPAEGKVGVSTVPHTAQAHLLICLHTPTLHPQSQSPGKVWCRLVQSVKKTKTQTQTRSHSDITHTQSLEMALTYNQTDMHKTNTRTQPQRHTVIALKHTLT